MHMTRQYRAAAGRARNAAEKTAGFWTQGARTVTGLVPVTEYHRQVKACAAMVPAFFPAAATVV